MAFKLRLVQRFQAANRAEFLELEHQFAELERRHDDFPKGKRYLPFSGREPLNTLIWECEFETLAEVQQALAFFEGDHRHEELAKRQLPYFQDAHTEIYETLEGDR
ncbi:hypothetical protein GZH47_30925 [Paenibacillus rhizovicinus]|uniref:Dabb family protein n=1 Tax=Paenibacillus rhizovicinus TaxID=2704463 RepID=A0A6C0P865_9BACL|nr:hypothetical protein [Paenibacillus rhizovicinus]QHW34777.1 hypothetical protein GZH47_30925 [Paenibacillus rhizovicinus]